LTVKNLMIAIQAIDFTQFSVIDIVAQGNGVNRFSGTHYMGFDALGGYGLGICDGGFIDGAGAATQQTKSDKNNDHFSEMHIVSNTVNELNPLMKKGL
jgi:hypothetical protein